MNSNRGKTFKERLLFFVVIYLTYAILFTGEDGGPLSRFLSNARGGDGNGSGGGVEQINQKLEFVHITETGGSVIEKTAASAGFNWGACHFISMDSSIGCANPDYEWKSPSQGNYVMTSLWHTPPKDLLAAGIDQDENNPYLDKELFTVVRNPYTRMVAEYYNPYTGGSKGDEDSVERMNSWISRHISDLIQQRADYKARVAKGEFLNDIQSPDPLNGKHFNPQIDYVYNDEGKRVIKNVIHFEDLKSEFKALMKEYEFDSMVKIPRTYRDEKRQFTYLDLYPETISLINQIANGDFEAFGYEMVEEFDPENLYNLRSSKLPCSTIEPGSPDECERDMRKTEDSSDEETSQQYTAVTPIGLPHATTFMLGIFSDLSDIEAEARQRIRNTYLQESDEVRICSLQQYISQHETSRGLWVPCRIPYVFIVAGDPQRPDEHLDNYPLFIDRALISNAPADEDDIVYLNISENDTHSGKARAYFKWAAKIGETYHIDFIGKASSSTLLDTTKLLNFLDMELPPAPLNRRMYGGSAWGSRTTYFATKPFYFMSTDLAAFVGQRKVKWDWVEAIDIGKIVFSHPKPIKFINCNPKLFWFEGLDTHDKWYNKWNNNFNELPRSKPFIHTMGVCKQMKEDGQI